MDWPSHDWSWQAFVCGLTKSWLKLTSIYLWTDQVMTEVDKHLSMDWPSHDWSWQAFICRLTKSWLKLTSICLWTDQVMTEVDKHISMDWPSGGWCWQEISSKTKGTQGVRGPWWSLHRWWLEGDECAVCCVWPWECNTKQSTCFSVGEGMGTMRRSEKGGGCSFDGCWWARAMVAGLG